jgi:uncharacterized membrane protein YdfJ with MMPL/SSD domain
MSHPAHARTALQHLGGLGTTATGTLVANIPVLRFCIAFGLSMDYEVASSPPPPL